MSATIETQRVIILNVVLYCNNTFASLEEEAAFNMRTRYWVLTLLLVVAFDASSQDYYPECISFPKHAFFKINVNPAGEIVLLGRNDTTFTSNFVVVKLDKLGKELWRHQEKGNQVHYHVDASDNIFIISEEYVQLTDTTSRVDTKVYKFSSNGKLDWTRQFIGNFQKLELDDEGNAYILTQEVLTIDDSVFPNITRTESNIYKCRGSNGDLSWTQKIIGGHRKFELDNFGDVYILYQNFVRSEGIFWPVHFYEHQLSKVRRSDGGIAWSSHPFTLVESSFSSFSILQNNAIYLVRDTVNQLDIIDLNVTKYAADGATIRKKTFYDVQGSSISTNPYSEIFISTPSRVIKLNENGDSTWSLPIFLSSLRFDDSNELLGIAAFGYSTILYKIDNQQGKVISRQKIPLSFPSITAKMDKIYATGHTSDSIQQSVPVTKLFVLPATLTSVQEILIDDGQASITVESILIDPSGSIYLSGTRQTAYARTFIEKYTDQKRAWRFLYHGSGGPMVYDFEGNLLLPHSECLIKIYPCNDDKIAISNEPNSLAICPGTDATFEVSATGAGLSYYWYKDSRLLINSTKFEGVNSPRLVIKQVGGLDIGSFYCTIKGGCGDSITSKLVTLNIIAPPQITAQPADATYCAGEDAVLKITSTGGSNVIYQWKKGNAVLVDGPQYTGANSNILTIKKISQTSVGEYYCELKADCQLTAILSQKAILGIGPSTSITKGPESFTSCVGTTANLTVTATGSGLKYQWKKNDHDLIESPKILGVATSTLTMLDLQQSNAGEYTCVVSGSCGSPEISPKGTLIVNIEETITENPENVATCSEASAKFSISTSGIGASYQWIKGNTILANNAKFTGVDTPTLSVSRASAMDEGAYACVITTSCGNRYTSKAAHLNVSPAASITSTSSDLQQCSGEIAKLYVTTSEGVANYQWEKDGIILTDNTNVTGSNRSELYIGKITDENSGAYSCVVTPACGFPTTSGPIRVDVTDRVIITKEPGGQVLCEEEELILAASVEGTPASYQWKFNGDIREDFGASGSKTNTLTINSATIFDEGYYVCEVTGCNGIVVTKPVHIKINKKPKLILNTAICGNPYPEWSDIVLDQNSTHGEYLIFKKGSDVPLEGLMDISQTGVYTIVKQTESCFGTIEWNNTCLITEIEQDNADDFTIIANPTGRWITFQYNPTEYTDFELYDSKGVRVSDGKLPEQGEITLDGNDLHGGLYVVRVTNAKGGVNFQRLILAR